MTDTTDERILTAAEKLFAERGYGGTTTRALAEEAGINEVTLFRRFGSKMGVLDALFHQMGVDALQAEAASGELDGDAREVLERLAMREIEISSKHGGAAMRIAFDARTVPEIAEKMGEGPQGNLHALAARFRVWQKTGQVRKDLDPRVLAEAFSSLTSSVVMYRQVMGLDPTGSMPAEKLARQLSEVFLTGVLADGGKR